MSMTFTRSRINFATRRRGLKLRAAFLLIGSLLLLNVNCLAQTEKTTLAPVKPAVEPADNKPLTSDERAELLKLIRSLQERVDKLEAAQAATEKTSSVAA